MILELKITWVCSLCGNVERVTVHRPADHTKAPPLPDRWICKENGAVECADCPEWARGPKAFSPETLAGVQRFMGILPKKET